MNEFIKTPEDLRLVVGYVCYHQNLLLFSSHVSHGRGGGSLRLRSASMSECRMLSSLRGRRWRRWDGANRSSVPGRRSERQTGLDEKLWLSAALWEREPLDV